MPVISAVFIFFCFIFFAAESTERRGRGLFYYLVYNDIVFRLCTLCIGLVPFSVVMNSSTLLSNAVAIWIESNAERLYLLAIS